VSKLLKLLSFISVILLVSSTIASAGGDDPKASDTALATVTGTITYRERIALPADAVVRVQLLDVSLMDVAATLIGEQTIKPAHSVPIPFVIPYEPSQISERMSYSVSASIRSGERLLFISDMSYPVLTRGSSNQVDLVLKKINP
jgi:putative lipoprotein